MRDLREVMSAGPFEARARPEMTRHSCRRRGRCEAAECFGGALVLRDVDSQPLEASGRRHIDAHCAARIGEVLQRMSL